MKETVYDIETHWLSTKEKVSGITVSKNGDADRLLKHKRTVTIDFLEKYSTVNCFSNSQFFRQNLPYLLNDPYINIPVSLLVLFFLPLWMNKKYFHSLPWRESDSQLRITIRTICLGEPVSWGYRIHQLHLCRGVRLLQWVSKIWH